MARKSYVQDPVTGKLVPKEEYVRCGPSAPYIQGDMESFVSPIDGTVISDRSHLREHNRRHGVTDSRDYSPEYMAKRQKQRSDEMTGRTREAKQERKDLINNTLRRYGI